VSEIVIWVTLKLNNIVVVSFLDVLRRTACGGVKNY